MDEPLPTTGRVMYIDDEAHFNFKFVEIHPAPAPVAGTTPVRFTCYSRTYRPGPATDVYHPIYGGITEVHRLCRADEPVSASLLIPNVVDTCPSCRAFEVRECRRLVTIDATLRQYGVRGQGLTGPAEQSPSFAMLADRIQRAESRAVEQDNEAGMTTVPVAEAPVTIAEMQARLNRLEEWSAVRREEIQARIRELGEFIQERRSRLRQLREGEVSD